MIAGECHWRSLRVVSISPAKFLSGEAESPRLLTKSDSRAVNRAITIAVGRVFVSCWCQKLSSRPQSLAATQMRLMSALFPDRDSAGVSAHKPGTHKKRGGSMSLPSFVEPASCLTSDELNKSCGVHREVHTRVVDVC
jgi:hypothetical protein